MNDFLFLNSFDRIDPRIVDHYQGMFGRLVSPCIYY